MTADKMEARSRHVYRIFNHNWIFFPITILLHYWGARIIFPLLKVFGLTFTIVIYRLCTYFGIWAINVENNVFWTADCTRLLLIRLASLFGQIPPYACVLGLCLPMFPFEYQTKPKLRNFRYLRVCLVTKGVNREVRPYIIYTGLYQPLS